MANVLDGWTAAPSLDYARDGLGRRGPTSEENQQVHIAFASEMRPNFRGGFIRIGGSIDAYKLEANYGVIAEDSTSEPRKPNDRDHPVKLLERCNDGPARLNDEAA
jgi:hypothetical protein